MKRLEFRITIMFMSILLILVSCSTSQNNININRDLTKSEVATTAIYYGQNPPGLKPELFSTGIISTEKDMQFGCTFSPDGQEIFYTIRENMTEAPILMTSQQIEGVWQTPEKFDVIGEGIALEPHLTQDGKTLYFGRIFIEKSNTKEKDGIWRLTKTINGWDDLTYINDGMYVSTIKDGSIYMTDITRRTGLVKLTWDGTTFSPRVALKGGPNSPVKGIHPCIAPDESFIIFDCERSDGYGGEGDLYVSFNLGDNTWSDGFNLGPEINSEGVEFAASLSPDGKYIFYMKNFDLYWVDVSIIEQFRPTL